MQTPEPQRVVNFLVQARLFALVVVAATVALPFVRPLNGGSIITALSFSFFLRLASLGWRLPVPAVRSALAWGQLALFGLFAAGCFWVVDMGFSPTLDVRLGLAAFPALVLFYPLSDKDRDATLFWFSVSVSIMGLVLLATALRLYLLFGHSYYFAGASLAYPLGLHRVYFALHALAALVFVQMAGKRWLNTAGWWLWQVFLAGFVVLLASRNVTLLMLVLTLVYIFWQIYTKHARLALVVFISVSLLVAASFQLPYVRGIFSVATNPRTSWGTPATANPSDGVQMRYFILQAARKALATMPPWGYGTGAARHVLTTEYQRMGFQIGAEGMLNAHNQYVETLLDIGWLGLILLLCILFYGFYVGLKGNPALSIFMVLCAGAFMTESYLEAQKGVVFMTLFWTVLGTAPTKKSI